MIGPDPINPLVRTFVHAMRELGYVEGKNLILERLSAEGRFERAGEIMAGLIDRRVDVIVAAGDDIAVAAKRVTRAVPIVMLTSTDPVAAGMVASLARPGGNITGFTDNPGLEIDAKRLQMLKAVVPGANRIAFLGTKGDWEGPQGTSVQAAARSLGVTLVLIEHTPENYADAFARIARDRPHALFVARRSGVYATRQLLAAFVVEQRIPSVFAFREFVEVGALLSYGASRHDLYRRAAGHVDKILRGTRPANLPVEQPIRFELVINLRTAKTLGITIPQWLLVSADELIE